MTSLIDFIPIDGADSTSDTTKGAALIGWRGSNVGAYLDNLNSLRTISTITATAASQTTFTVPGGYTIGQIDVFLNGFHLTNGIDYAASNGTTVVLQGATVIASVSSGSVMVVSALSAFSVANTISATTLAGTGGAASVGFLQNGTGAVGRTVASKEQDIVSAKDFGAKGDGVTDDTAALQALVTYITTNKKRGYIPEGTYVISSPLTFPQGGGYSLVGAGKNSTIIKQTANNVAILSMGGTGSSACVFIEIAHMYLSYANSQAGNTSANAIYLQASYYFNSFHHLRWEGYCGLKVISGVPAPQNTKFDEIDCTALTYGSMMDWTGTNSAGPNWVIGRMQIACNNMVGPAFNNIKGTNANIDCLEFLSPTNCQLMVVQAGSNISINTMKMEVYTFNTSGQLFTFSTNCNIKINQFICYGTTASFAPASGNFVLFNTNSGGSTGSFHIDFLSLTAITVGSNVYILQGSTGQMRINQLVTDGNANWLLSNVGGATTCETTTVDAWNNGQQSQNLGDANYTIVLGNPNLLNFETAFTAARTINLPAVNSNLFNGLYYDIRSYGAVNGANTLAIVCNGTTKYTIATDKTTVRFTYRRNAANAQGGWIMTRYETLP